ncbi:unnamed protein product [Pylaiella littoralis]
MPDVIKPGPPGGEDEDEQQDNQEAPMDLMGSGRDFPLQVKQGCTAQIQWTKQSQGDWKVSSLVDTHVNCAGATTPASIRGVNDVIEGIVNNDLGISGPKLNKAIEAATGSTLSLRSVQRAKQLFGELTEAQEAELMKLRPYLQERQISSPGTVTNVEADADGPMTSCFVMTGKAVHVAQTTGVKVASMDSGFLKTAHHGQLITLGVKDDNNRILLVAFAIVDKEDEASYTCFLRNCMRSGAFASTFNSADMTIFTDGHKGFPPALKTCLPRAQTYRCLQHLLKNAPPIGSNLVNNVFTAARAPSKAQFDSFMRRVQSEKPGTFNHLMSAVPLSQWTHHACKQDTRIGYTVTSNNAESLINMVGAEVRGKIPLLMVEGIVDLVASKCAHHAKTGSTSGEHYTPHAVKTFDTERTLSNTLVVTEYGSDIFKVESFGDFHPGSNTVDLAFGTPGTPEEGQHTMKWTCGFCVRHRIPCCHVLAVAKRLNKMDVARRLIDKGNNAEKYRAAYGNNSFRIRPPSLATLVHDPTLLPPKPVKKTAGRPKGKRKKKRVASNGEHNTSSRYNTRTPVPLGARPSGAAGTAGVALLQPTLSRPTASQPTASQHT